MSVKFVFENHSETVTLRKKHVRTKSGVNLDRWNYPQYTNTTAHHTVLCDTEDEARAVFDILFGASPQVGEVWNDGSTLVKTKAQLAREVQEDTEEAKMRANSVRRCWTREIHI